jgi:hypothetical protein
VTNGSRTEQEAEVILRPTPHSMPGQLRTVRRLALLSLLLDSCRDSQANLRQLHVLNWAARSRQSREVFLGFVKGFVPPDEAVVRFDPSLPRVLKYAISEGLISDRDVGLLDDVPSERLTSYRVKLTPKGKELAELVSESDLLTDERLFLQNIGRKVTQKLVQSLFDWGQR